MPDFHQVHHGMRDAIKCSVHLRPVPRPENGRSVLTSRPRTGMSSFHLPHDVELCESTERSTSNEAANFRFRADSKLVDMNPAEKNANNGEAKACDFPDASPRVL